MDVRRSLMYVGNRYMNLIIAQCMCTDASGEFCFVVIAPDQ